jgi:hypothetical protein
VVNDIDTLHLRSHAESVCRDHDSHSELYEYTLDILCLMALADAFGFEYGEFVN